MPHKRNYRQRMAQIEKDRRKKLAEETPEERRRRLDAKKARAKELKEQREAAETPEEREQRLASAREAWRISYQRTVDLESDKERRKRLDGYAASNRRQIARETPEKRSKRLEYLKERSKKRSAEETPEQRQAKKKSNETPEQQRERLDRVAARKREKKLQETPEQRRQRLDAENVKARERRQRRLMNETPEQTQQRLEKQIARKRKKEVKETPEERQQRLEKDTARKRKKEVKETPEERKQRLDRNAEIQRMRRQKRPKTEEQRERARFYMFMKNATQTDEQREEYRIKRYFYRQACKQREDWEERRKLKQEKARLWRESLTGEKKERYLASVRRAVQKQWKKQYEQYKNDPVRREKALKYQRERYARETPEETLRRRRKDKMNNEKRRLRKRLEEENTPAEEIELQLKQLGENMWREFYPNGDVPIPGSLVKGARRGRPRNVPAMDPPVAVENATGTLGGFNLDCKGESFSHLDGSATPEHSWLGSFIPEDVGSPPTAGPSSPASPMYMEDQEDSNESPAEKVPLVAPGIIQQECFNKLGSQNPIRSPVSTSIMELKYHHPTTTEPLLVRCPHCPDTFSTDQQLRAHLISHHTKKCWRCPQCREVVLSSLELSQHFATAHANVLPQNSTECRPSSKPTTAVGEHCKYLCMKCPPGQLQKYTKREFLFKHVQQRHSSDYWPCENCRLLKYSEHALILHQRICRTAVLKAAK